MLGFRNPQCSATAKLLPRAGMSNQTDESKQGNFKVLSEGRRDLKLFSNSGHHEPWAKTPVLHSRSSTHTCTRTHTQVWRAPRCSLIFCAQLWPQTGPARRAGETDSQITRGGARARKGRAHAHVVTSHYDFSKCHAGLGGTKAAPPPSFACGQSGAHAHSSAARLRGSSFSSLVWQKKKR